MKTPQPGAELWPYSARNGVFVDGAVRELLSAPEVTLRDAEKEQAYAFAADLFEGYYTDILRVATDKSLEAASRIPAVTHRQAFYTGYLDTEKGQQDYEAIPRVGGEKYGTSSDAMQSLRSAVAKGETVDSESRKLLAANSEKWRHEDMKKRLFDAGLDYALSPDFESETINFKPDVLLDKCRNIQAYRTFYREVKRELKSSESSPLNQAKQVLTDVYLARANSMLAELYPGIVQLALQLDNSETSELTEKWRSDLYSIAPVISSAWKNQHQASFTTSFMQRLDRMRNGVGLDANSCIASISSELTHFAAEVEDAGMQDAEAGGVSAELVSHLEQTNWGADQVKQLAESVLADWNLLSDTQSDWKDIDGRMHPAADEKWQVVVVPKDVPLSVDAKKKVVIIPDNFDRPLLAQNPSGVLPVVSHELSHVVQAEEDEVVSKLIPLAKLKGRRSATGKEMGGVQQESLLFRYFGQQRHVNTSYLRALQAKIAGANQTETAKAFMDSRLAAEPNADRSKLAKNAASATSRLYRHQGYNTQPLDYLEQGVMLRELRKHLTEDAIAAVAMTGTSFSLHDAAALHNVDLLDVPATPPKRPAEDVLRIYFERFHDAA